MGSAHTPADDREAATALVSPRAVPNLADAAEVAAALAQFPEVAWSALVAGPGGAARALAAGTRDLEYVVAVADGHSLANARRTSGEALDAVGDMPRVCMTQAGSARWSSRSPGTARSTAPRRPRAPQPQCDVPVGGHFHDTREMGIANALAAVQAGVTMLDASTGGLGGWPFAPGANGNIATEELVHLLEDAAVDTDVRLEAGLEAARVARDVVAHDLPSGLLRAGGRSTPRPRTPQR